VQGLLEIPRISHLIKKNVVVQNMSRDRNAGQSPSTKIDNSIERVEEFKHLGTTLTNQNSIQVEIKSRLKSGNACYHSVQNPLPSSMLSKNLNINIYRTIILPVV
jgi:UDP-galactopyranose mutase